MPTLLAVHALTQAPDLTEWLRSQLHIYNLSKGNATDGINQLIPGAPEMVLPIPDVTRLVFPMETSFC